MKTYHEIRIRVFPLTVQDERTGTVSFDRIAITKEQLQAAQLVGQSSKELIHRIYSRAGFKVLSIGKAVKRTITVDLISAAEPGGVEDERRE